MAPKNKTAAGKTEPLIIERTFQAPSEVVWHALTDVNQMRRWFFGLESFKPEVGFQTRFVVEKDGKQFPHLWKITEVVPGKKIAYSWKYEGFPGDSVVTFELFDEAGKTRLKLTHTGLDTFQPENNPTLAQKNFEQGWTHIVGSSLKTYLEDSSKEMIVAREFDAPRELVWEAWTNPKHVANWWGPNGFTMTIEEMDVRSGGVWKHVMHGPNGTDYPNHSVFTEVVKPERIAYSNGGGKKGGPEINFTSTWTFEALSPNRTRLTIHHVFLSTEIRDKVAREYGAIEGGKQTLARLAEYLSKLR